MQRLIHKYIIRHILISAVLFLCLFVCFTYESFSAEATMRILRRYVLNSAMQKMTIGRIPFDDARVFFDGVAFSKAPWIVSSIEKGELSRRVMRFQYDVSNGYAGYYVRLHKGNMYKRYNAISVDVKGNVGQLKVEIKDKGVHAYTVKNVQEKWQRIVIPFEKFTGAESFGWNDISEIVFVVEQNRVRRKSGEFFIGEVSFVRYKEEEYCIGSVDMSVAINDMPLDQGTMYVDGAAAVTVSLSKALERDDISIRLEARAKDGTWFYLDEEPYADSPVVLQWQAQWYPATSYATRLTIRQGERILHTSQEYSVDVIHDFDHTAFLEKILRDTFLYFEKEYQPETLLIKDRNTADVISTGACGFALAVYPLAAERGFIERAEAQKRVNAILHTYLTKLDSWNGFYQHWFDFSGAPVHEGRTVDAVETSYMVAGAIFCRQYYRGASEAEVQIRERANALINRVQWRAMLGDSQTSRTPLFWLYHPESKEYELPIQGFNECMITYVTALAAPHRIPANHFSNWYNHYAYENYEGKKVVMHPSLFTQHYSFMFLDPRMIKDRWVSYFDNAQQVTLANRKYCMTVANSPVWGLTACDGPEEYAAYGVALPFRESYYDGTVSPSASLGSLPFVPEPVIANARIMYERYGDLCYGKYGFYDSFNLQKKWSSQTYLGITQGTIYLQIENYLRDGVWQHFMQDTEVEKALKTVNLLK